VNALRFVVPMPNNVTNPRSRASRNWRAAHTAKTKYWYDLDVLAMLHAAHILPLAIPAAPAARASDALGDAPRHDG
jgi:hypothetical protein